MDFAYEGERATLLRGNMLHGLANLPPGSVDALITDPPYCSGGVLPSQRMCSVTEKYCHNGDAVGRPEFTGDTRDQRSFLAWCTLWLDLSRRAVKPGGYAMVFVDWRQLPSMTDAIQAAGWRWRGVIAWDKGRGARAPHKGYFRHQCEFIVWATNGECSADVEVGALDGCFSIPIVKKDKHHMTGKPVELMRRLVERIPAGGLVLDPFAGSASTGVAALLSGRRFVGMEETSAYCEISAKRLAAAERGEVMRAA